MYSRMYSGVVTQRSGATPKFQADAVPFEFFVRGFLGLLKKYDWGCSYPKDGVDS